MSRVVHFVIPISNPERARNFYKNIFKWEISNWNESEEYFLVTTGTKEESGIDGALSIGESTNNAGISLTIQVKSINEAEELIKQNGGEITSPKMAIEKVGYIISFKDTEGNILSIMEPDPEAK